MPVFAEGRVVRQNELKRPPSFGCLVRLLLNSIRKNDQAKAENFEKEKQLRKFENFDNMNYINQANLIGWVP